MFIFGVSFIILDMVLSHGNATMRLFLLKIAELFPV